MAVHFVYRCGYLGPTCLHRRTFPDDATVLDFFRNHWRGDPDIEKANEIGVRLLGTDVAYFDAVLANLARESTPPPQTMEDVANAVTNSYISHVCFEEHCIQALVDDDETDMAFYFFDDVFLEDHGDLAAYILRDDWRLPDGGREGWSPTEPTHADPGLRGQGCLYLISIDQHTGEHLEDGFGPSHVRGLRVRDLCRWVMGMDEDSAIDRGCYLPSLREVLLSEDLADNVEEQAFHKALQQNPGDELTWNVYADWTQERGFRLPGLRLLDQALGRIRGDGEAERNLVQVGDHIVQLFAHDRRDEFEQVCYFDDLWGGAHPTLADALLRFANRWDVLSTGNETRWD